MRSPIVTDLQTAGNKEYGGIAYPEQVPVAEFEVEVLKGGEVRLSPPQTPTAVTKVPSEVAD